MKRLPVHLNTIPALPFTKEKPTQKLINENKNRSIFRKNIGRCIINKENNPYQKILEYDTTSKKDKEKYGTLINKPFEQLLEKAISAYIQTNLSFTVFSVATKEERLFWESKLVSTLAASPDKHISETWLGNYSPKDKIRQSGLWQVNELNTDVLDWDEFSTLSKLVLCYNSR